MWQRKHFSAYTGLSLFKVIEHITTTPYHPQANNCVEQFKSIVFTALRKLSQEDKRTWAKHIPTALLMARSCVNKEIHFSPFEMVYRYNPEIHENPKRLKIVEPACIPMGDNTTPELKNIYNLASEQGA